MVAVSRPVGWSARYGWVFAAIWLFYLSANVRALLAGPNGWAQDVGLVAVAGFAVLYLYAVQLMRQVRHTQQRPPRFLARVGLCLLGMLALFALQIPGAGATSLTCLVYITAVAMIGLPLHWGIGVAATLFGLAEALPELVPGWTDQSFGLAVLLAALATWGVRLASERQSRLLLAQEEIAALAVQNERARIAADLHDILGHSLTVVTVKAELAQRLLDVDVERARKELGDLEGLARDALSDVRATAMGVRGISLPGEIAAAREALAAAHIEAELPGAADEVPTRVRELFAWTIREAVTNVVRHSKATRVAVRLTPDSVEIVDDGVGAGEPASGGQGLPGLRRRAEALGAVLTVGCRGDTPGFRVRMEAPS